ncbi:MAG: hypothetical protein PVJ76_18690 [Gemmatimonadota bacterium]|jgi:hypothetical protein
MIGQYLRTAPRRCRNLALGLTLFVLAAFTVPLRSAEGQSTIPRDQFHISVTLGGHFLIGVGYTRWIEEHHALEFTAFPFAHPKEGFPFGLRAGYAWVPSDEVWRAKLGGGVTVLIRPGSPRGSRFTPTLDLTPGIRYDADHERSFRADAWLSYFVREKVFAPTGIEFFYCWPK